MARAYKATASNTNNKYYLSEMKNLVAELQWRGMVQDMMPGTEEQLLKEMTTTYVGFDPTSDSLHIGNLVPIILLVHVARSGHKPIALVGGATGMIGDPSGKSDERNLLDEATLEKNVAGIKAVLSRFLDFNSTAANAPILVNNYDWMKDFSFINFARDVGKRITVNYMMAKDSVKKRLSAEGEGMSFTEFTYQLIQGYDFHHLYKTHNCLLQMGGSDQWGNITTGTELVRRMNGEGAKAYAMTCPLITKADGSKFGKSEGGNVWLTADKTSVYKFYQFWLNTTDVDAEKYIKIFTFLDKDTIEALIAEHQTAPHLRVLQKRLAEEVTAFVHGTAELEKAGFASGAFFSPTMDDLKQLDTKTFLEVFEGVPQAEVEKTDLVNGLDMIAALSAKTGFLASNSDARRELQQNSISLNKEKVAADYLITEKDLINNQFLMLQKGKKNYYLIKVI
jgi:tyrosyl-tRNA synthetase